ncbi:MAG: glycosyltransferase [Kastovskya adunca ATA6-11-RM4]|jgi:glycosyltransferase involved in cell wall biosynthesis|nr:glycosyltransferase [Kastovskya adunca ATA6-11-RM4]
MNNSTKKIGYLLLGYPKLSETFILNEILELENQGLSLQIFSLRHSIDKKIHLDVKKVKAKVTYIPSLHPKFIFKDAARLLWAHLKLFLQNPKRYINTFRFHRSRSEIKSIHANDFLQAGYLALDLKKAGISHLHAHFADIPASLAEVAYRFCEIPYSFTAHAKDIYLSPPETLARRINEAKFVLTCTKYNQKYLQDISGNSSSVHLAYHGLNLNRFQPSLMTEPVKNEMPLILSIGRFCEKKGFPDLLKACHLLKQNGHQFQCEIVGYGSLQDQIEQLITKFGLDDVVTLVGQLTQDELVELYRQADIFVLACRVAEDGDRDGIPNVLIEAMAMKTPVISTNISAIAELIDHRVTGILVPQKNPQALAKELETLITQPELLQQLQQAGRAKVRQMFSTTRNVKQVKDLLLEALDESAPAKVGTPPQEVSATATRRSKPISR